MIAPDAAVQLRFAGESNAPYYNAMLARSGKRTRLIAARGPSAIDAKMIAENRAEDRDLFPKHVLIGWRGIRDTAGQPVECTLENRKAFCAALPSWIFDQIRNHAGQPERFLHQDEETPPDSGELAKN